MIIIKKGAAIGRREPAALVADAPKAEVVKVEPAWTPQKSIEHWKRFPSPDAKPRACPFCGRPYIKPCAGDEHLGCQNFHFAEVRKKKAGTKPSEKSVA